MSSPLILANPASVQRHGAALGLALLLHLLLYWALLSGGLNLARRTSAQDAPRRSSHLFLIRLTPPALAPAAVPAAPLAGVSSRAPRRSSTGVRTADPVPVGSLPAEAAGARTAGASAAPSAPADFSGAPALDLQQLRAQARENEKTRVKTVRERIREGELIDRSLEAHVGDAARRAVRPDCEKAFAGVGLLAVIPLAASLVTDVGCKWR